jgi:hypothetical protein
MDSFLIELKQKHIKKPPGLPAVFGRSDVCFRYVQNSLPPAALENQK